MEHIEVNLKHKAFYLIVIGIHLSLGHAMQNNSLYHIFEKKNAIEFKPQQGKSG